MKIILLSLKITKKLIAQYFLSKPVCFKCFVSMLGHFRTTIKLFPINRVINDWALW